MDGQTLISMHRARQMGARANLHCDATPTAQSCPIVLILEEQTGQKVSRSFKVKVILLLSRSFYFMDSDAFVIK